MTPARHALGVAAWWLTLAAEAAGFGGVMLGRRTLQALGWREAALRLCERGHDRCGFKLAKVEARRGRAW